MLLRVCVDAIIIAIFIVIILGVNRPLDSGNQHYATTSVELAYDFKALAGWFECFHSPELSIVHLFSQWSFPSLSLLSTAYFSFPILPVSDKIGVSPSSVRLPLSRSFSSFLAHLPSFQTLKGVQTSNSYKTCPYHNKGVSFEFE